MRILITNDDGINAPAILPLAKWAKRFGDVTVVAPKKEQSGKSHSIEIFNAFEVKQLWNEENFRGYSLDSTPADCVRFAFTLAALIVTRIFPLLSICCGLTAIRG